MNPYLIPGLETTPYAPLCPHLNDDHDTFYVQVDDTAKEYGRYQKTMNSVRRLTEGGRLVVVTGKSGCGKTSLINRCAAWLRNELAKEQLTGEIFVLTDSGRPNQSIMLRMEEVLMDLVDNLRDERRGVGTQHIKELQGRIEDIGGIRDTSDRHVAMVDRAYRYLLQDALAPDQIAIVLLPPSSELVNEIKSYADFARHPRIVFFAETDSAEAVDRIWQEIPKNDRMAPILLRVGLLNAGDGWTYAHARQKSTSADSGFPTVSEETMQRVTSGGTMSIGRLHWLLHGVYEELASDNIPEDSLPFHEVSYEYITDYVFRFFSKQGNLS